MEVENRKRLNIDSPSFTPAAPASILAPKVNVKLSSALASNIANVAPFKPKSSIPASSASATSVPGSPKPKSYNPNAPDFVIPGSRDFQPQSHTPIHQRSRTDLSSSNDVFSNAHDQNGIGPTSQPPTQPYTFDSGLNGHAASSFIPSSGSTSQVLQHHLYAPVVPQHISPKPNQRNAKDIFLPEDLRLRLQKKAEATLRSFANSQLPNIEFFHTLTPLEPIYQKSSEPSQKPSSVYKAISDEDGKTYCLRRIHDHRVLRDSPSAQAVVTLKSRWQPVRNSNIVAPKLAFSSQLFGDNSIIIVSDFYADSMTLRDRHIPAASRNLSRTTTVPVSEHLLWSYLVQMANALKAMHSHSIAARGMDAARWLLTDEDHIRFNAGGILDITDPSDMGFERLQRIDLHQLGELLFSLGTANANNKARLQDHFNKFFTPRLRHIVDWLLRQDVHTTDPGTVEDLCRLIACDTIDAFDASLRLDDTLQYHLARELENGRLVRLLLKLNTINDRPEYQNEAQWRDQGQRNALKLFRDYVFHQVDANGSPVIDMGHMLACLNKLDAGLDEKVMLTTTDGHTVIVVSFREMKAAVDGAWGDLMRRSSN